MDRDERVDALEARLCVLEERLARLEKVPIVETPPAVILAEPSLFPFDLAAAGKAILILGGAFLLRAPTDAALIPRQAGVAIGLLYAAIWIFVAVRATNILYAITAAAIAYPIVWEATARFHVLPAIVAAVLLVLISAAFIVIAKAYTMVSLAWIAAAGATCIAVLLAWSTESVIPFVMVLIAIGVVAMSVRLLFVGWLLAAESDLFVLVMIGLTLINPSHDSRAPVVTALLVFTIVWLAMARMAPIQAAVASLIGIGGAGFLVLDGQARAIVWGVAAVVAAEIARRSSWRILTWQSVGWGVLAVTTGPLAAAFSLLAFLRSRHILLLAIAAYGAMSLALQSVTVPFVQTIILALSTIALAVVGRVWRVEEASQVAMLLLIGTGLKIALFDIRSGAAVTMFGTLLVYGGAVLCVARLRLTPSRS